jgi:DNA-binding transcriptional regulator GbsR (MarR family)
MSAPRRPETGPAYLSVCEGIVAEIRTLLPGLPLIACELVTALHIDGPLSMNDLASALGRSKSRVQQGLHLLKAAGMITQRRDQGAGRTSFTLRSAYPEVVIDAFVGELRRVRQENHERLDHALVELGYENGRDAHRLLTELGRDIPRLLLTALHEAEPKEVTLPASKAGSRAAPKGEP